LLMEKIFNERHQSRAVALCINLFRNEHVRTSCLFCS
jgi:hypothetical protein